MKKKKNLKLQKHKGARLKWVQSTLKPSSDKLRYTFPENAPSKKKKKTQVAE